MRSSKKNERGRSERGIRSIYNQLLKLLEKHGVVPFESIGETFDPELHEAVRGISTNEHPPDTVIAEFQKGYKMGDEVLRPARVGVAQKE
ncbi:MAG: nucleotide exchange factor GrpE [Candidatus Syntropharchaeia archaeon]